MAIGTSVGQQGIGKKITRKLERTCCGTKIFNGETIVATVILCSLFLAFVTVPKRVQGCLRKGVWDSEKGEVGRGHREREQEVAIDRRGG